MRSCLSQGDISGVKCSVLSGHGEFKKFKAAVLSQRQNKEAGMNLSHSGSELRRSHIWARLPPRHVTDRVCSHLSGQQTQSLNRLLEISADGRSTAKYSWAMSGARSLTCVVFPPLLMFKKALRKKVCPQTKHREKARYLVPHLKGENQPQCLNRLPIVWRFTKAALPKIEFKASSADWVSMYLQSCCQRFNCVSRWFHPEQSLFS